MIEKIKFPMVDDKTPADNYAACDEWRSCLRLGNQPNNGGSNGVQVYARTRRIA